MTTQTQLLGLAKKRVSNPAVSALLTSIQEAQSQVASASMTLRASADAVDNALKGEAGFSIALDNSHIVVAAAKMSAALTRIASDYFTLATVLQAAGEDVSY